MIIEWKELSTLTKIFYFAGLISFIGLALMILTGMTSIGAILRGNLSCVNIVYAISIENYVV